jgi:hypothetical protein
MHANSEEYFSLKFKPRQGQFVKAIFVGQSSELKKIQDTVVAV